MGALKSKITSVLIFIFIIIIILGVSSMVLVYRLGMNSQAVMQTHPETVDYSLEMLKSLSDLNALQLEKVLSDRDSLNIDTLLSRFEAIGEIFEMNLRAAENLARGPDEQKQVEMLKGSLERYRKLYNTLRAEKSDDINRVYQQFREQFEKLSGSIAALYDANLQAILARIDQKGEMTKYSLAVIFVFTGINMLLMFGSGIYCARAVQRSEKELSETLQAKNAEKREFIAHISHELKTSVSAINLSIKILSNKRSGKLSEEQRELIESIGNQTKRLLRMVNETREFSKRKK